MTKTQRMALVLAATAVAAGLAAEGAAAATLVAAYKFKNSLSSSVGSAPDIKNIGPGKTAFVTENVRGSSKRVLAFPQDNGLKLATRRLIPSRGAYSVRILFRFTTVAGYERILDARGGTSDNGLYDHSGALDFYDAGDNEGPGTPLADRTYAKVAFTRNASKRVTGYVNGHRQFRYHDSSGQATLRGGPLIFFRDNLSGGTTGENSAGAVSRIRVYRGALTAAQVSKATAR